MCSKGLAKFILFATNFFLFIAGGVLLGFGIAAKVDPNGVSNSLSNIPKGGAEVIDFPALVTSSANFMIAVGCFLFIFCFLGCFGGCCEITWMLFLFWVALLVIILLEVALIIFAAVSPSLMKEQGIKFMMDRFKQYKPETILNNGTLVPPKEAISLSFFAIQAQANCCGVVSKEDYKKLTWDHEYKINGKNFTAVVPPSCCINTDTVVKDQSALEKCMEGGSDTIHKKGCYEALENEMQKSAYIPIIICVVVIVIELISISAAIYLWRMNKNEHQAV